MKVKNSLTKYTTLLVSAYFLCSCSLYSSYGRRYFESHSDQTRVNTLGLPSQDEERECTEQAEEIFSIKNTTLLTETTSYQVWQLNHENEIPYQVLINLSNNSKVACRYEFASKEDFNRSNLLILIEGQGEL